MFKCVIIDDEPHAIEGLKNYIEKVPELQLYKSYTNPVLALRDISQQEKVDLILLDIDMPEISGIELAKLVRERTSMLVFTTAHTRYGYDAFTVKADGYLLKPYSLARFLEVIEEILSKSKRKLIQDTSSTRSEFMFIKSKDDNHKLIKVWFDDIVAVESKNNYIHLYTKDRGITTYMSLTEISKQLPERKGFIQFQRSFILGIKHIESIDGNVVAMVNGKKITVGDYYKKDFAAFVSCYLLKAKRKD